MHENKWLHVQYCALVAVALVLAACATDPKVLQQRAETAAQKKVNVYQSGGTTEFALIIERRVAPMDAEYNAMKLVTDRFQGIGNMIYRFTSEDPIEPIRYVNILDITKMHLDASKSTPSYIEVANGNKIAVSPFLDLYACNIQKMCQRYGGSIGLFRMSDRRIKDGKVSSEISFKDYNNFSRNAMNTDIVPTKDQGVVDVTVLRGKDSLAIYQEFKGAIDKQKCDDLKASLDQSSAELKKTATKLDAISRNRPLTNIERLQFENAQRGERGYYNIPLYCRTAT